ncbi:ankyrin [Imleria badia]|nr:ankyrin [Imleria badia]
MISCSRRLHLPRFVSSSEEALVGLLSDLLGWDFSLRSSAGETSIYIVAGHGHILTVTFLRSQNIPLLSDILLAALRRDKLAYHAVPLVYFLIREGACVNIADSNGDTPLHLALRCRSILDECGYRYSHMRSWKAVEILLDSGPDPSTRNVDGQTPFDVAEMNGRSSRRTLCA